MGEDKINTATAWINGRTLNAARKMTTGKVGDSCVTERVPIDLARDSYVLGIEHTYGFPFVIEGDLLVTIHDFDLTTSPVQFVAHDEIMTLANLHCTRRALSSASSNVVNAEISETRDIEQFARSMDIDNFDQVYEFSKKVCEWGKVPRVWGNLKRFHPDKKELGRRLSAWLKTARACDRPSEAIELGTKIEGLGVSFASKHLRLLDPERFATLDEVISTGLGYALNGAGYNLWLHDLNEFKQRYNLPSRIGDVESGIFILVRQIVRGTP